MLAHSEPVVRVFLARRLQGADVEDAVQTVMERALERKEALAAVERPRAWLLGIARNVVFETRRARARAIPTDEDAVEAAPETSPGPEEHLRQREEHNRLYQALAGLRTDDQLALLVTYVDGLRGPQAAEVLGVSFPAFRQRLSRARKLMEQRILDLADAPEPVDPATMRAWRKLLDPDRRPEPRS